MIGELMMVTNAREFEGRFFNFESGLPLEAQILVCSEMPLYENGEPFRQQTMHYSIDTCIYKQMRDLKLKGMRSSKRKKPKVFA